MTPYHLTTPRLHLKLTASVHGSDERLSGTVNRANANDIPSLLPPRKPRAKRPRRTRPPSPWHPRHQTSHPGSGQLATLQWWTLTRHQGFQRPVQARARLPALPVCPRLRAMLPIHTIASGRGDRSHHPSCSLCTDLTATGSSEVRSVRPHHLILYLQLFGISWGISTMWGADTASCRKGSRRLWPSTSRLQVSLTGCTNTCSLTMQQILGASRHGMIGVVGRSWFAGLRILLCGPVTAPACSVTSLPGITSCTRHCSICFCMICGMDRARRSWTSCPGKL